MQKNSCYIIYDWLDISPEPIQLCVTSQAVTNSRLKTFYPWRIPSSKHISPKEFQAQNTLPLKNSKVKIFYPSRIPASNKFQAQYLISLKNSQLKTYYPWRIFSPEFQVFKAQNTLALAWRISNPLSLKNSITIIGNTEEFLINFTSILKNSITTIGVPLKNSMSILLASVESRPL